MLRETENLESLEAQVAALESQKIDLDREIHVLNVRRNGFVPISRLPTEILCNIFMLVRHRAEHSRKQERDPFGYWRKHKKLKAWTVITHVCHRWRNIALDCPALWSTWSHAWGPSWFEAVVDRSRDALITLELDFQWFSTIGKCISHSGDTGSAAMRTIMFVLERAFQRQYRFERVALRGRAAYLKTLLSQMANSTAYLTYLAVWHPPSPWEHSDVIVPSDFPIERAPLLKTLTLVGYPPGYWDAPDVFNQLTDLKVDLRHSRHLPILLDNMLKTLSGIPGLTKLDLTFPTNSQTLSKNKTQSPIELRNLKSLRISANCTATGRILGHLRLPASLELKLEAYRTDEASLSVLCAALTDSWFSCPLPQPSSSRSAFQFPVQYLRLRTPRLPDNPFIYSSDSSEDEDEATGIYVHNVPANPGEPQFHITITAVSRERWNIAFIHRLLSALPLHDLQTLHVSDRESRKRATWDWLASHPQISQIEELIIDKAKRQVAPFKLLKEGLSASAGDGSGARAQPHFPQLQTLQIHDIEFDDLGSNTISLRLLKKALSVRNTVGKRIKKLVIEDCSEIYPSDAEGLKLLVDEFEWDGQEFDFGSTDSDSETDTDTDVDSDALEDSLD
ncbi:hypothetical protein CC1G_10639 [Coprinopsis cinerea okayama7|uniref:Uncharacterized protein n=1 Tax=Coprinopsis cinerea (strain Okayama-7 / 130 / ATCC MYA-4618 / FGSC 9003) TaxID=240176 RepID=A8P637_COPC7|nr:hypothetical protein CC1G_10639 [Coprinopsis cinerea okayama7\|eukprot:XP_001839074.2 hypothetical protein CC1G_10639 [Coprinopsis cinerea okayama7\